MSLAEGFKLDERRGGRPVRPNAKLLRSRGVACILAASDVAAFVIAFALFRHGHTVPTIVFFNGAPTPVDMTTIDPFFLVAPLFVLTRYMAGDYTRRYLFWDNAKLTTIALLIGAIPDTLLLALGDGRFSAAAALGSWVFLILAIPLLRQAVRHGMIKAGIWRLHTVIVASAERAKTIYAAVAGSTALGFEIRWLMIDEQTREEPIVIEGVEIVDDLTTEDFVQRMDEIGCAQIIVDDNVLRLPHFEQLVEHLLGENIPIYLVPTLRRLPVDGMPASYAFGRDVLLLQLRNNLHRRPQRILKRGFDLVSSLTAIVLLSPLLLFIGIAIKLHDSGPIFYSQARVGRRGREFRCLKFRTMAIDADERLMRWRDEEPELYADFLRTYKLRNDPRITKPGALLRRLSLDELPQLLNVLVGEMSMVGPRPIPLAQLHDQYGSAAQLYQRVRPGLTGLWQISGRSNTTSEERVAYDEWYILNWSFWYDLVILIQTAWIVVTARGAY